MIRKGVYKHVVSGKMYNVLGVGRHVGDVNKMLVMYEQMYESRLRGSDVVLPIGHLWVRDVEDFNLPGKFEYVGDEMGK